MYLFDSDKQLLYNISYVEGLIDDSFFLKIKYNMIRVC